MASQKHKDKVAKNGGYNTNKASRLRPQEKKFFRTVVKVEVLAEDRPWNGNLKDLSYDIRKGDFSGQVTIKSSKETTAKEMAKLLEGQGTDPEFFGIDSEGNLLNGI